MLSRLLGWTPLEDSVGPEVDVRAAAVELIDVAVVDALFFQLGTDQTAQLIDQCFTDFDTQIHRLHSGVSDQDWTTCLSAIHGMKGIAIDWGATALVDGVTSAKNALVAGEIQTLAENLIHLVDIQRETRSALLVHLAKFTATSVANVRSMRIQN